MSLKNVQISWILLGIFKTTVNFWGRCRWAWYFLKTLLKGINGILTVFKLINKWPQNYNFNTRCTASCCNSYFRSNFWVTCWWVWKLSKLYWYFLASFWKISGLSSSGPFNLFQLALFFDKCMGQVDRNPGLATHPGPASCLVVGWLSDGRRMVVGRSSTAPVSSAAPKEKHLIEAAPFGRLDQMWRTIV